MANVIYDKYKEALLSASTDVSLIGGNVKISLIDSDVASFQTTQQYYSEVEAGEVGVVTLANTSVTNGVFNADDVVLTGVSNTAANSEALVIWIDTANTATSRLVAWLDTNINGLPITPDGTDINITWNTSGIFKL